MDKFNAAGMGMIVKDMFIRWFCDNANQEREEMNSIQYITRGVFSNQQILFMKQKSTLLFKRRLLR